MQGQPAVWQHIIINTRSSWLTGDPRGFRSRNHRKHSAGDYKSPPPAKQYDGLHRHVRLASSGAVDLPRDLWPTVGLQIRLKAKQQAHAIECMSVDSRHVHLLAELPADRTTAKRIVGTWKQRVSHAVRDKLPGEIWAKSCDPILICDVAHHERAYQYILDHASEGAWTWAKGAEQT